MDPLSRALEEEEQEQQVKNDEDIDQFFKDKQPITRIQNKNDNKHLNAMKTSSVSFDEEFNERECEDYLLNDNHNHNGIDNENLHIRVSEPKKQKTGLDTYYTYLITSNQYNDSVKVEEHIVRRRYNDFVWLKTILDNKYPFNIIPPLPSKHSLTKKLQTDNMDFIRKRIIGLQNFLQRLADNPIISIDNSFQLFLSSDDQTLKSAQGLAINNVSSSSSTSSMSNVFQVKNKPLEFVKIETYTQQLNDNLRKLERLAKKLEYDNKLLYDEQQQYSTILKQWMEIEKHNNDDDDDNRNSTMPNMIQIVADSQQSIVDNQLDLSKTITTKFIEPINEYILFTNVVNDILKRRDQLNANYETMNEMKHEKQKQVTQTSNQLNINCEHLYDQLTIANETIKADIQRWNERKDKELIDLLRTMAIKKIDFYQASLNTWEHAANALFQQRK
ncbi:unnamed protein product [Didymodactylos carnosus]|uniref:PX domain-containing protein n=1 Tax=Didymodactylos carnosus TaxID=1234261 RepID=A0A8S2CRZ3_9BILA|nr:unnamed protein product [Didymodactylos carnosus]CAF3543147.1 unnamed protein product [Didymodactylos carnosus]